MTKSTARRLVHQIPPGSDQARQKGCVCRSDRISEACPLHGEVAGEADSNMPSAEEDR